MDISSLKQMNESMTESFNHPSKFQQVSRKDGGEGRRAKEGKEEDRG